MSKNIFQGALEMQTVGSTTTGVFGIKPNNFPNFSNELIFNRGDWFAMQTGSAVAGGVDFSNVTSSEVTQSYGLDLRTNYGYLATSSNALYLQGSHLQISQSVYYETDNGQTVNWSGPGLAVINTVNYNVYIQKSNYISPVTVGGNPGLNAEFYPGIPIATPSDNISNTP